MHRIAVLDDYQRCAEVVADWSNVRRKAEVAIFDRPIGGESELVEALKGFDVVCLMRERTPFPPRLVERLPALKLVVLTGRRSQTFDIAAAQARGIEVLTTDAGPAPHATPELTLSLILALARHIPAGDRNMKHGRWLDGAPLGQVLNGRALGIIGLGRVGARVAEFGRALGMRVMAWSPNLTEERAGAASVVLARSKSELLKQSDVVSLHLVLSESTRGIIAAADLASMKSTALLVNTARGPLIVEDDLVSALSKRQIAGAALDVYDIEPLPADSPLRRLDNVILTPHFGYVTQEIYSAFYKETVSHLEGWLGRAGSA